MNKINLFTFSKNNKEKEMQKIRKCDPDSAPDIVQTLNSIYNIRVLHLLFNEHKKVTGTGKNYSMEIIKALLLFLMLSVSMISLANTLCALFNAPVYLNVIFDFIILGITFWLNVNLFLNEFYLKKQELLFTNLMLNTNKINTVTEAIRNIQNNLIDQEIKTERETLHKNISTSANITPAKQKNRI